MNTWIEILKPAIGIVSAMTTFFALAFPEEMCKFLLWKVKGWSNRATSAILWAFCLVTMAEVLLALWVVGGRL